MRTFKIVVVPRDLIEYLWEDCLPLIHSVTDQIDGDLTPEGIKKRLLSNDNLLVLTMQDGDKIAGLNVLEVGELDSGVRIMYVPVTAGTHLDEWMQDFYDFSKEISKQYNCGEVRGMILRESWLRKVRAYGFERVFTVIKMKV